MMEVLMVDFVDPEEEAARLEPYKILIRAGKENKRMQSSAIRVNKEDKLEAVGKCNLDPRVIEDIRLRNGTVVQKVSVSMLVTGDTDPCI